MSSKKATFGGINLISRPNRSNMKKPLFFIAALLASSAYVGADPIDAEQAKALASAYMREGRTPELVQTPMAKRDASGQAPLYIFNRA